MLRNLKGWLSRPAWTNQHSPVSSPSKIWRMVSITASTGMIGMPSLWSSSRIGPMIAVSAKPGQTALMRMSSMASDRAEGADEADHGVLVGGVDRVHRHRGEASERGGGDDRAAAAGLQRRQHRVDAEDDAVDVDPHRAAVGERVEVGAQLSAEGDAGVEEGEIEAAALLDRDRHRRLVLLDLADVAGDEQRPGGVGQFAAGRLVDVAGDHPHAAPGQRLGQRPPKAAGGAGDQCNLLAHPGHPLTNPPRTALRGAFCSLGGQKAPRS